MKQNELSNLLHDDVSLSSILALAAARRSKLTPEQKQVIEERRKLWQEQKIIRAKILQNICPNCEGKLVRGKKDKTNDYKRVWACKDCESRHYL